MGRKNRGKKAALPSEQHHSAAVRRDENPAGVATIYSLQNSPVYGRFVQTEIALRKGSVILTDEILCAGPMRSSKPVCLGCHSKLESVRFAVKCERCGWPLCSRQCENSNFHAAECKFFVEHDVKVPDNIGSQDFGAIAILRGLLLKLRDQAKWEQLNLLESHDSIRRLLPLWQENQKTVVDFINSLGLQQYFTPQQIHKVCGIMEVNAFELGQENSYRGIFPKAAMMAHNCVPNASHFDLPADGKIEIRAAVDIPPGVPVTICYAYSLEGTAQRRRMLMQTKFFECDCDRCSDPYEHGTNLSTLVCSSCGSASVVNTLCKDKQTLWRCATCQAVTSKVVIDRLEEKFQDCKDKVSGIKQSEEVLKEMAKYFHPGHYLPFGIKFNLCQIYGRDTVPLQELSDSELQRKLNLCSEVLATLNCVIPGLVLYELQATEIIQARRIFESRKFSKALLKRRLEKVMDTLVEAIEILSLSEPSSPEFKMAMSAKVDTLSDLKSWIHVLRTK